MKRGSAAAFVFAFVIAASCGGTANPTGTTPSGAAATAPATGGAATGAPTAGNPSFGQVLGSAKTGEYKVTYQQSTTGAVTATGEQSWYFKPPKTRFDFSSSTSGQTSTVSLYSLPDGVFMCFGGTGMTAQCIGMSGLDTALQQNPAALYQSSMIEHPEQWNGVLTETRQIAGQQALCYDVKPVVPTPGLGEGRFCYSTQGIPLLQRFTIAGGTWSMEATKLSTTVPDSDFELPSKPTILGKP
ncbi:MAG: hypothetical protein ACRDF9_13550 [Candidatus Limnocylindria bacterium]